MRPTDLTISPKEELSHWIKQIQENGMEAVESERREQLLQLAVELGDLDALKLLIKYYPIESFNINLTNSQDETLLDIAHKNGHIAVELYLKGLRAVYGSDSEKDLELTTYSESEIADWIRNIKEQGIETIENERQKKYKADGISEAVINRIDLKLALQQDIITRLHEAAYLGNLEKLRRYVEYARSYTYAINRELASRIDSDEGARVELSKKFKTIITIKNELQHDALLAVLSNRALSPDKRYRVVELLLQTGVDPGSIGPDNESPLHLAARLNDLKTLKLLIDKHALSSDFNINLINTDGRTPLDIANYHGHTELAGYLKSVGALTGNIVGLFNSLNLTVPKKPRIPEVSKPIEREHDSKAKSVSSSVETQAVVEKKLLEQSPPKEIQDVKKETHSSAWAPKEGTVSRFRYKQIDGDEYVLFQMDEFSYDIYKRTKRLGNGLYGTAYLYEFEVNTSGLKKSGAPQSIVVKSMDAAASEEEISYEVNCALKQNQWAGRLFDKSWKACIATSFKPGENVEKYKGDGKIKNLEDFLKVAIALVKATNDFHQNGWVHGDIHTNNMVIREVAGTDKIEVDLIDFGMSRPIGKPTKLAHARRGHPPELKDHIEAATNQDVYRLGHVLEYLYKNCCSGQKNPDLEKLFARMQCNEKPEDRKKLPEVLAELFQIEKDMKESYSKGGSSTLFGGTKAQADHDRLFADPQPEIPFDH